ncbi:cupin domain-containing protein [Herbaspirillum camelliae]|uniref:cupin domain-containing protein n=1 Tax=Herbaspirillum camelliae TaxID=1892903 RepID=UPI000949D9B0|nr:cupin domain-containing protein [Herbaspirillum camelliae]
MQYRRIVTGHDASGQSIFLSDAAPPRTTAFQHIPGFVTSLFWETEADAVIPAPACDPAEVAKSWVPVPNGTNLIIACFPPDSVMTNREFDPIAARDEYLQVLPGLAEKFESDSPGMHTTDTVDYAVLLDGELHLELDGGAMKRLAPHDVVIQNGTRHAWRNTSDKPATILFVLVGARRT